MLTKLPINEAIDESTVGRITCAPPGFVFICGIRIDPPSQGWAHKYLSSWQIGGLWLLGHYVTSLAIYRETDEPPVLPITELKDLCYQDTKIPGGKVFWEY